MGQLDTKEAAAQGLIAGTNAEALAFKGKSHLSWTGQKPI